MAPRRFSGRAKDERAEQRARMIAARLEHRMRALSWWRAVMSAYPGGVVPINTAAAILGVSRTRVLQLIAANRLPVVEAMPSRVYADRFVPLDALLAITHAGKAGRPVGWCHPRGFVGTDPKSNPWLEAQTPTEPGHPPAQS